MTTVFLNNNKIKVNDLLSQKIRHAVGKITGKFEYNLVHSNENLGQMFIIEHEGARHYVAISSMGGGRNTFVFQPFATAYKNYLKQHYAKKLYFLIIPTSDKNSRTDYQIFAYRCLKTLSVDIINLDQIDLEVRPFDSLNEFIEAKNMLKSKHAGNISSFIKVDESKVVIYGKLSGANNTESLVLAFTAKTLAEKELKDVIFEGIKDKNTISISSDTKRTLFDGSINVIPNISKFEDKTTISGDSLRKGKYKNNLKKKFGTNSECYLCECKIPSLMVSAHIHRVADIKREDITEEEKRFISNDGDNGFWLCQNHDKMFEDGLFYFEKDTLLIASFISEENRQYILDSITKSVEGVFKISPEHYNANMEKYLKLHQSRVRKTNI